MPTLSSITLGTDTLLGIIIVILILAVFFGPWRPFR